MKTLLLFFIPSLLFAAYNPLDKDFLIEVDKGNVPGHSLVQKFGFNDSIGSTLGPITTTGDYPTPPTAQTLEILSDDADDNASGLGGRSVIIEGLGPDWTERSETVSLDGTTPVTLSSSFTRVYRMALASSGVYSEVGALTHQGTITLRESGGGDTWAKIALDSVTGMPMGQSEIGVYTIPAGKTGYLIYKHTTVESSKTPSIYWFRREGVDVVTAPFKPRRLFERHVGVSDSIEYNPAAPIISIPEKTDIGAMGYVPTGNAAISVEFQILLVDN